MDGVPYVSFPPIKAGTTFTYEFPIRQTGTYWYHSHSELQEQSGVYGAIVIEPKEKRFTPDREHVIVLSDWTDEDPHSVIRTLRRGSEWYALQKGSGQSIMGAARAGMLGDYFKRELQRMPAMDIADVAYDRFLANGRPESILEAAPGETVRLRIIDGSATTFFHLEFSGGPMTVVAADGIDVEPVEIKRFLIGVAETYDVLIDMPETGAYELRATAHDGSAFASLWLGNGARHPAPDVPKPNLYHSMGDLSLKRIFALTPAGSMGMADSAVNAGKFDQPGMMGMDSMDSMSMEGMDKGYMDSMGDMHGMKAEKKQSRSKESARNGKKYGNRFSLLAADVSSSDNLAIDGMDPSRPWPPYDKLRALEPTAYPEGNPVRSIRLTLDGDMGRYVWFLNNRPISESHYIRIRENEVVRFIMINRTMMHHPMHLHGHFFRVINQHGDYSPLKHTVNVAPMSTTVIEFLANEVGDWFFHCHLLYHMKSGMARVVHYENFPVPESLTGIRKKRFKEDWYSWSDPVILSNMSRGALLAADIRNTFAFKWETGWQNTDEIKWEAIFTWNRFINRFFTVFAGANLDGARDNVETVRGVLGFRYLLPLNIASRVWVDTDLGSRFSLEKHFELTPRFMLLGEVQYDTRELWEGHAGLSYTISKFISLMGQWHSEYGWGGGIQIRL
jgi:CopA family copper-resistance protein